MQFVGVARVRTCLGPHLFDRCRIELSEVAARRRLAGTSRLHRMGTPLLERRIVEERVWLGIENLVREE